jgi:peptide/nickel transport system permease protein
VSAVDGAGATGRQAVPTLVETPTRSNWAHVWRRFRSDRVALVALWFLAALMLAAFVGAPLAERALGHGPEDIFPLGVDQNTTYPVGPWTWVNRAPYAEVSDEFEETFFLLGGDRFGRDLFLRILYGARTSLQIALLTSLLTFGIGGTLGLVAGFRRGWFDAVVSRSIEVTMVLPGLLFMISLRTAYGPQLNGVTLGGLFPRGVVMMVVLLAAVTWFYPARVIRGLVVSLREQDFVDAARMTGAGDWRIMRSHLLPYLVGPAAVLFTIGVATTIIAESGLTYLGLGIEPPTASWGNLLSDAVGLYLRAPLLMVWPGLVLLVTTASFNLVGDALREAVDPQGGGRVPRSAH